MAGKQFLVSIAVMLICIAYTSNAQSTAAGSTTTAAAGSTTTAAGSTTTAAGSTTTAAGGTTTQGQSGATRIHAVDVLVPTLLALFSRVYLFA